MARHSLTVTHLLRMFQIQMAGAIIDNMSSRKVAMLAAVLVVCQVLSFLVGAVFAPSPNNTDQLLATKCYDPDGGDHKTNNENWFYPRGTKGCKTIEDIAQTAEHIDLGADNVVFTFQMPLPRDGLQLDYSR